MEFFDKKEDVIDLQLTQFGRHMLAKGMFKPVFYSFFDDNIMYNSETAGITETQNDSEGRIREAQTLQPQISVSSLEKEFGNNYNLILSDDVEVGDISLQRTADRNYILPQPIGTSDINSEFAPSWSVVYLNGKLSGNVDYLDLKEKTGGNNILSIPQLQTDINIKVSGDVINEGTEDSFFEPEVSPIGGSVIISNEEETFVLLKVAENNGLFQKENFDIEMYEIQEEIQGTKVIETIRPLSFTVRDEATDQVDVVSIATPNPDKTYAEYYFEILVDDEISDEMLCQFDPVSETMGVFSDPRTKECQDILNQQKKKVFDIYKDEADYPGEVC